MVALQNLSSGTSRWREPSWRHCPLLLIDVLLGRYFIRGLWAGSLKGSAGGIKVEQEVLPGAFSRNIIRIENAVIRPEIQERSYHTGKRALKGLWTGEVRPFLAFFAGQSGGEG